MAKHDKKKKPLSKKSKKSTNNFSAKVTKQHSKPSKTKLKQDNVQIQVGPVNDKPMTRKELKKQKKLIDVLNNHSKSSDHVHLLNNLSEAALSGLCRCMGDFFNDRGKMKGKLPNEYYTDLRTSVAPFAKDLRRLTSKKGLNHKQRLRIINKKQKGSGGSVGDVVSAVLPILGSVVGALL